MYIDVRIHTVYRETTCTILGKRLKESRASKGRRTYAPEFTFRYQVNGRDCTCTGYDSWPISSSGRKDKEKLLARYEVGKSYPCWYDPQRPERAALVRKVSWIYLVALLPLVFVAIGVGGIYLAIRSPGKLLAGPLDTPEVLPSLKTTQGSTLPVRLRREMSRGAEIAGLLAFCIIWNGIVSVFVVQLWREWQAGKRPLGLTLFLTPFVLIGLGVVVVLIHRLLAYSRARESLVELVREPVNAGETVQVAVTQPGPLPCHNLTVTLRCEERVVTGSGKRSHREVRVRHEQELVRTGQLHISAMSPWTQTLAVRVPQDAAQSSKTLDREIVWMIAVKGELADWPDFEHGFPFRVVSPEHVGRLN